MSAADLAMRTPAGAAPMHIGVTGASGLIGSGLIPLLVASCHRVTRLVRRPARDGEIQWGGPGDAGTFRLDPEALAGMDAIVHLAGENIARRWTRARKRKILEGRREGTRVIAEAMARTRSLGGPGVLISASAIGYYGDRGDETLTEASSPGTGFLPEVAMAWERATEPAEAAGVRVVRLRIGLALTPAGGLLKRMLPGFRLGLGGRLGSGRQWMSWISMDDLLEVFCVAITHPTLAGPLNAVAPEPVRNAEFTRTLARLLGRPAVLPVPAFALRLVFGEMADQAILASGRVLPSVLTGLGHRYRHATLEAALRHLQGRER